MQAAQDSFISSTYWTERIGPAAALATIRKHRMLNVPMRLMESGSKIQGIWRRAAERTGLPIDVSGLPPLAHFTIKTPEPQAARTLFTQLMLERGFLASNAFYANYAHSDTDIESYGAAVTESFAEIARAIEAGTVQNMLKGPVAPTGFYRLT